jgi:hypothetical protein
MNPKALDRYSQMEVANRRPGSLHPDECPKLRLHGVDFAIPPRGLRIVPKFDGDTVSVSVGGVEDWPEAVAVTTRLAEADFALDIDGEDGILPEILLLARKLLLAQYRLGDDQLGELLAFESNAQPAWIKQLLHWSMPAAPPGTGLVNIVPDANAGIVSARPWWAFWR